MPSNQTEGNNGRSRLLRSATIAATSALVISITVIGAAGVRVVLNGLFDGRWRADWSLIFVISGCLGAFWFLVQVPYIYFKLGRYETVEEAVAEPPSQADQHATPLSGFVAMEYFCLILNRTFVVFVAPEGLYGWRAEGPVTASRAMYFELYVLMLRDPELMRNHEAVKRLAKLPGGFFIPRRDIIAVDVDYRQKWGMGPIPHSGRIRLRTASGDTRKFILLGSVDPDAIQRNILSGGAPKAQAPHQSIVPLPDVSKYSKKLWVPLFLFFVALALYFAFGFIDIWKSSNWALILAALLIIGSPIFLLLEFVVQKITFTETEILQTTRLGKVIRYDYSAVRDYSGSRDAFLTLQFRDGRVLKLYAWQGDPRTILSILQSKTNLAATAEVS